MNANYISSRLKESLDDLQELMLKANTLTEEQFKSCEILLTNKQIDIQAAQLEVDARETNINLTEREMQKLAINTLLLHTPVGYEFRFCSSMINIGLDYERMGDELEHIFESFAFNVQNQFAFEEYENIVFDIMATCQQSQFNMIKALIEEDTVAAEQIIEKDSIINNLVRQGKQLLVKYQGNDIDSESTRSHIIESYIALRSLERYGDHIKNICQQIIYILNSEDSKAIEVDAKKMI